MNTLSSDPGFCLVLGIALGFIIARIATSPTIIEMHSASEPESDDGEGWKRGK